MSTTVDAGASRPAVSSEAEVKDGPRKMQITFNGAALRKVLDGATMTRLKPQEFVREAVRFAVEVSDMRRRGYEVVLRDPHGNDYKFPPSFWTPEP